MKSQSRRRSPGLSAANGRLVTPSGSRIPPAWTDVYITDNPQSSLQAVGRDSRGRKVYLYSAEHTGVAAAAKFSRLKAFARTYPSLIQHINRDKKTTEEALVLYLIAKTGFRIGSDADTRARVKAYGASTLRCSHLRLDGETVAFDFTGKKGIRLQKTLKDAFLARALAVKCPVAADRKIFRTNPARIREYLNSLPRGARFSVKDFRTYLATTTALRKIRKLPAPGNQREYRRMKKEIGEIVGKMLGDTAAIAMKSYVSPEVFCTWEDTSVSAAQPDGQPRTTSVAREFIECIHYDIEEPPAGNIAEKRD